MAHCVCACAFVSVAQVVTLTDALAASKANLSRALADDEAARKASAAKLTQVRTCLRFQCSFLPLLAPCLTLFIVVRSLTQVLDGMSKESAAAAATAEAAGAERLKRSLAVQSAGHEAAIASLKVRRVS